MTRSLAKKKNYREIPENLASAGSERRAHFPPWRVQAREFPICKSHRKSHGPSPFVGSLKFISWNFSVALQNKDYLWFIVTEFAYWKCSHVRTHLGLVLGTVTCLHYSIYVIPRQERNKLKHVQQSSRRLRVISNFDYRNGHPRVIRVSSREAIFLRARVFRRNYQY